ncbi:P-loop containing nucleoside triphosphate hydrolase protein [Infundibulicybe gibba]|nr:P-loop containing nucleoside triphosphate hydrolase protein [Infundibulicybe gibba]
MLLSSLIPTISTELSALLESHGIIHDTDILFAVPILDIFRQLPPGSVTLHELSRIKLLVAEAASAAGTSGSLMLHQVEKRLPTPPASLTHQISAVDGLLGSFDGDRVIEVSGNPQSGKTTLALHTAVQHLVASPECSVLWIDTTGEFSPDRASAMLSQHKTWCTALTALERLQVALIFEIEDLQVLLGDLFQVGHYSSPDSQLRLIVIDAITPLLGPLLSGVSTQGHAIMSIVMRQLRELAQSFSLSVMVINNTTALIPGEAILGSTTLSRKPALGPSFRFLSDATIWLSITQQAALDSEQALTSIHSIEVLKSRYRPSGTQHAFKIREGVLLVPDV